MRTAMRRVMAFTFAKRTIKEMFRPINKMTKRPAIALNNAIRGRLWHSPALTSGALNSEPINLAVSVEIVTFISSCHPETRDVTSPLVWLCDLWEAMSAANGLSGSRLDISHVDDTKTQFSRLV